jgi:FtsP/CotA-like multicopper oxidase with cupredoxin domain
MLSDWTDLSGAALFARLKKMAGHDNYYRQTLGDLLRDARRSGLHAALRDRLMWGAMRMSPTDLSDVNANTYTYLMNGSTALGNWTGLFRTGEKLRLRFINGSAMTYFDVRIPGLQMTVVAADGQLVHPVTVEELRIAVAETFDVIVAPTGQDAFTIFAQDSARTGYVSGTLAVRAGMRAPVPQVDPRPLQTMADMGMDHGTEHAGMAHGSGPIVHPASESGNPLVDNQTASPTSRLEDPGVGLRDNGRSVLSYAMLRSAFEDPDGREPQRELTLHLTGHMEKFAWSFDGIKFSSSEPLRLNYGERLRIVLVNDTMMTHPIHLHGMWSDVEDDHGAFMVRKHTVDMPPGSRRSYRVRADALGRWAYHCHLVYHMESGMMREVRVEE